MHLIKNLTAKFVVEPCVASGLMPSSDVGRRLFRWALHNRDFSKVGSHPLSDIWQVPEWDNTYALSRASMAYIWQVLREWQPHSIIEFGCGRSSIMFGRYCHLMEATCLSIEADPDWGRKMQDQLAANGLESEVTLHLSDSIQSPDMHGHDLVRSGFYAQYGDRQFDLVSIDGPVGGFGRGGTLLSIKHQLAPKAHIIVDDSNRTNERHTINRWLHEFGPALSLKADLPLPYGLTILEYDKSRE